MKRATSFGASAVLILILMSVIGFAQTESSTVKTIQHSSTVFVTEPMIALNPTDQSNFITVYSNWHLDIRHAGSSMTTDGGDTWTGAELPTLRYPNTDQADPSVTFDANGLAYYCCLENDQSLQQRNSIVVTRSTNKGASWGTGENQGDTSVVVEDTHPVQHDKPWITADCTSGSYRNTLYVVWTRIDYFTSAPEYHTFTIYLSYKRPGQRYFSSPIQVSSVASIGQTGEDVQGAFPVVGNDGALYVFWSKELGVSSAKIMMRKSTNGGQSFVSLERELYTGVADAEGVILGGAFPKAHSWPFAAVDPMNGSLNMVYGDGVNVKFAKSTDGGNNWTSTTTNFSSYPYNQAWNPCISCNAQGRIAIAYYAANWSQGMSLDNSTVVNVATSSDGGGTFTSHKESGTAFNPRTWQYSDYIGVAYNSSTYWGVWPQAVGTGADLYGRYRTVRAVVENVDDSQQRNSVSNLVSFDLTNNLNSPYTTVALLPGITHTVGTSPSIQYQGITYSFVRWEDETGTFISNSVQTSVQIESHRYRAVFSRYMVNVAVKNEFKEPNSAVNNVGTVNIDDTSYVTDNLPGKQKSFAAPQGEQHRFKANDQSWGSYYRGFNPYTQNDGGWVYPDFSRKNTSTVSPGVTQGSYTAKYRNRYTVHVNGSTPETGGTVNDITSPQNVWQYEGAVTAPSQITSGGRTFRFYGWSDGATANPDPNPPTGNTTYTALYKGVHISSDASAFGNNSQRKFVRTNTSTPWYHQVYTSMGHVWIEHSVDGVNWTLGNGGLPLDNGAGKLPSIDCNGDAVAVVFQEQTGTTWQIVVETFLLSGGNYVKGIRANVSLGTTTYSNNVNPNLAWKTSNGSGVCLITWESGGINYAFGRLGAQSFYGDKWAQLPGTDANSINASLYTIKGNQDYMFEVVWQQRVNSSMASVKYGQGVFFNSGSWQFTWVLSPVQISSSSIMNNYQPSMICDPSNNWYACWIADFNGTGDPSTVRLIYTNKSAFSSNVYYMYGINTLPKSCAINISGSGVGCYFAWSASQPSYSNKLVDVGNTGVIKTLNTSGKDIQMCGGAQTGMSVSAYYPFSTPYYFAKSNNLTTFFPKSSPNAVATERGCFIGKGDANLFYSFGNMLVNNTPVDFVETPDTVRYDGFEKINAVMVSQPIQISPTSKFTFTEFSSSSDSSALINVLGDSGYVRYKIDLVDNITGGVIGTVKNTMLTKANQVEERGTTYSLDTRNIGTRTVKAKITISTNLDNPDIALVKSFSETNTVTAASSQSLTLQPVAVVTDYSLHQNFPNPFNPSTQISYSIPKDGMVTLKIFDALGREVQTLVNEAQTVGRYEVTFDGSRLSSGVYFCRLISGEKVITKKMLMIK